MLCENLCNLWLLISIDPFEERIDPADGAAEPTEGADGLATET